MEEYLDCGSTKVMVKLNKAIGYLSIRSFDRENEPGIFMDAGNLSYVGMSQFVKCAEEMIGNELGIREAVERLYNS